MIGRQIANYRIVEKLGEGGMGIVYLGIDVQLDRQVAIKMLSPDLSHNPELVNRFQAEARTLAHVNHPNLATMYAFLVIDGNAFMVMEFVEGVTLEYIIRRTGPIKPQDAIPWFKQALMGIGAAHRKGIIHRDIKPSNLMLTPQWIVKVMDFGIAKALGTHGMTRTGTAMGTVAYMSPEQVENRATDVRTDIYALGVTLYQMLSGHVPFESDSDFRVMQDHVMTPPPPLTRYYPAAPREYDRVLFKALEKDPNNRFQSVEEFATALDQPEPAPPPVYTVPATNVLVPERPATQPGSLQMSVAAAPAPAPAVGFPVPAAETIPAGRQRISPARILVALIVAVATFFLVLYFWPNKTDSGSFSSESRSETRPEPQEKQSSSSGSAEPVSPIQSSPPPVASQTIPVVVGDSAVNQSTAGTITGSAASTSGDFNDSIRGIIGAWIQSFRNKDAAAHAACYAPIVETYFKRHNVSNEELFAEKQRAFDRIAEIRQYDVSRLNISVGADGHPVAVFEKDWDTVSTAQKTFAGKEIEKLTFANFAGSWKIVGEEELSVLDVTRQ